MILAEFGKGEEKDADTTRQNTTHEPAIIKSGR